MNCSTEFVGEFEPSSRVDRPPNRNSPFPASGQFDLCRGNDEFIDPSGRGREFVSLDAPAVVFEYTAKRRLAGDIAGYANRRRVEPRWNPDRFLLRARP